MRGLNTLAGDMADIRTRGKIVGVLTTSLFLGQFSSPLAAQPVIERFGSSVSFAAGAVILLGFSTGFGLWTLFRRPSRTDAYGPS